MVEKINTSIKPSEEVDKINEIIDAVVYKTGSETITGGKAFTSTLSRKSTDDDYTLTPSERLSANFSVVDKNGNALGGFEHYHNTDGSYIKQMAVRQQNSNNYTWLQIGITSDGTAFTNAPACDLINSIVTTVNKSKALNGYFKLGNGLIIQWGYNKGASGTINYSVPFSADARVSISCSAGTPNLLNTRATTFSYNCYQPGSNDPAIWWIAVGY